MKAHCGDTIRVDRKGRQSEFIENPCLTTLLFIQPDVLGGLVNNGTFRGRGLVARFLYAYPQSTVGSRKYKTRPISLETEDVFNHLCKNMLDIQKKEPGLLVLNEYSEALSERFYNELEPRLGKDGDLGHMADWAGKLHGAVLRIAGLIQLTYGIWHGEEHYADIPFEIEITEETMRNAVEIGEYFLAHATICYQGIGADESIAKAKYLLGQLEKKKPTGELRPSDIWRLCKGERFRKVADVQPSLELLTDYGYIRPLPGTGVYEGGRPKGERYMLNPRHFPHVSLITAGQ